MKIKIDGKQYKVVEDLGYQPSRGVYAKAVETNNGERIVIKQYGQWKWAKPIIEPPGGYRGQ